MTNLNLLVTFCLHASHNGLHVDVHVCIGRLHVSV